MNFFSRYKLVQKGLILFCMMISWTVCGQQIQISVQPDPLIVGEQGTISFTISNGGRVENVIFPTIENVTFLPNISSESIMLQNGRQTFTKSYGISANKAGRFTVPPMQVATSGNKLLTPAVTFNAETRSFGVKKADGTTLTLQDLLYAKVSFPSDRTQWYVGEKIPLTFQYYQHSDLPARVEQYPAIAENSAFAVQKITDPQTGAVRDFNLINKSEEIIGTDRFVVLTFRADLRPIRPGEVRNGKINGVVSVRQQSQRRRGTFPDDFFGDDFFGANYRPVSVDAIIPPLNVLPLPPTPHDTLNLGLVGHYMIFTTLSPAPYKVGDPLTLDVIVRGFSGDGIRQVPLNVEGFRSFPPEVSAVSLPDKSQGTRVRYVLIPLRPGELPLKTAFAFFDPVKGSYQTAPVDHTLAVADNPYAGKSNYTAPVIGGTETQTPIELMSDILYLKPVTTDGAVSTPVWRNHMTLSGSIFFIALLGWLLTEIRRWYIMNVGNDPRLRRRMMAGKAKKKLLSDISAAPEGAFETLCRTELSDWISNMKNLPPGMSPGELANHITHTELADALRAVESAGYRPGGLGGELSKYRDLIHKCVKRGTLLLVLTFGMVITAVTADASPTSDSAAQISMHYDKGEFSEALQQCRQLLKSNRTLNPALLYNMGNCFYRMQQYPEALVCYERARRLAPDDSDILSNLNAVCRKLEIEERGKVRNPAELMMGFRDSFRQDTWLLFAAAGFAVTLFSISWLRLRGRSGIRAGLLGGLLILTVSMVMFVWQERVLYRTDEAVVMRDRTAVYTLPAENSNQRAALNAGFPVEIRESRRDWFLIRYQGGEGWVHANAVTPLWGEPLPALFLGES